MTSYRVKNRTFYDILYIQIYIVFYDTVCVILKFCQVISSGGAKVFQTHAWCLSSLPWINISLCHHGVVFKGGELKTRVQPALTPWHVYYAVKIALRSVWAEFSNGVTVGCAPKIARKGLGVQSYWQLQLGFGCDRCFSYDVFFVEIQINRIIPYFHIWVLGKSVAK